MRAARAGSIAAQVAGSWLRYALSRAGERCCSAKTPPRSGLPASAICTEPKGGSNKGSRKEEEEKEEEEGEGGDQTNMSHNALWQEAIQHGLCISTGNFLQ